MLKLSLYDYYGHTVYYGDTVVESQMCPNRVYLSNIPIYDELLTIHDGLFLKSNIDRVGA